MFKKTLIIFLFFFTLSCSKINTLNDLYIKKNVVLTDLQIKRFNNYINGSFYSYELNRYVNAFPLAFLISKNGDKSVILGCEDQNDICNVNVQIYQLILKYNKKEKDDFKILALKKNIKSKFHEASLERQNKKLFKIQKRNDIFFDRILSPLESCDDDEC